MQSMLNTIKKTSAVLMTGLALCLPGTTLASVDKPGAGRSVTAVENSIFEEKFQTRIMLKAMEELGYKIKKSREVDSVIVPLAVANGDGDVNFSFWDPLHQRYFDKAGGSKRLTKLGNFVSGALQGYLVDKQSYDSGITNIGQLQDPSVAKRFDSNGNGKADLAGCVPGWGCELVIEHHMDAYELRGTVTHNQGAYSAIIADTLTKYQSGKPIIYYTWTPYWVSPHIIPVSRFYSDRTLRGVSMSG